MQIFNRIDILRKRTALSFAILLIITISFISLLGSEIFQLNDEIQQIQSFKDSQERLFLQSRIELLDIHLNEISRGWESFIRQHPSVEEQVIKRFSNMYLSTVSELVYLSIILVKDEDAQLIWYDYGSDSYRGVIHHFIRNGIESVEELQVLNGDLSDPFGGERIFVKGITLKDGDYTYLVQIAFYEPIIYNRFISTLDPQVMDNIQSYSNRILNLSSFFFVIMIAYGLFIITLIRWVVIDLLKKYAGGEDLV